MADPIDTFIKDMDRSIASFQRRAQAATQRAARQATEASRRRFRSKLSGREVTPSRSGRRSTGGAFAQSIDWAPSFTPGQMRVDLQTTKLAKAAPYWLIQDVGTGKSATLKSHGRTGAVSARSVSIKTQVGRRLPAGLVWTAMTGGGRRDQIVPRSTAGIGFEADAQGNYPRYKRIKILEEIKGKRYIQAGSDAGYAQLRGDLDKIFKSEFSKRR